MADPQPRTPREAPRYRRGAGTPAHVVGADGGSGGTDRSHPRRGREAPGERSTAAQGLPFHVQDPAILARVAALVNAVSKKAAHDVLGDRPADLAGTRRR